MRGKPPCWILSLLLTLGVLATVPARAEFDLRIEATDTSLADNLRIRADQLAPDCDADRWRVRRVVRRLLGDFDGILRAFGHYQSTIEQTLSFDEDCWQAVLTIAPGPRVVVTRREITIAGEAGEDSAFTELLADLPLAPGSALRHDEYEAIKQRLRGLAQQRGYLDFELTRSVLLIDPAQQSAEIIIEADSGVRFRIGEVRIGEQALDESFVRRLADIEPGSMLSSDEITSLDRRLSNSGYFDDVKVRTRRDQRRDGEVPVDILLTPAARHAWRFGIGYATDTGPRGSARYENRFVNPRGHRFESELRLSPVESGLTADYILPGDPPRIETFSIGAGLLRKDTDGAESDSVALIGRQVLNREPWIQTRFIELQYESSNVGGEDIETTVLMPGIALERLEADNPLRTRRGYRVNLEARGASRDLFSDVSFIQLRANARGIYRFGEGGRVTGRADIGTTPGDSVSELPASIRFFAGGDNSVRGYAFESLGPVDAEGNLTGGRHLLTGSLEYEHPVYGEDWWAGAFVDAGNAFNDDDFTLRYSIGLGARWFSPVGRVRLDVAFPDDTSDGSWRLHLGLGADL